MHVQIRTVAGRGVDALCGLVGRGQVVRAARFLLHRSRLDLPNHLDTNGERDLQRWLLATLPTATPVTVFDVGAHLGTWSRSLWELAGGTRHRLDLHAFEPSSYTHQRLVANLPGQVTVNRLAVSDRPGEVALQVVAPGAGRNSLHPQEGTAAGVEPVVATTVHEYATRAGLTHIHLLKIDAEGHDFRVLRGAARWFGRQAISAAQFEYNHRWVHSRHFLKDAFDLLTPLGYRIGKLTPRGIEWYARWDPELETFIEGNYLACTAELARRLPGVRWWKESTVVCTSA